MPRLLRCVILILATLSFGHSSNASGRLNVLVLMIDDLNTWLLEDSDRYRGKVIAPNIRRLADSGVLFKRAYTASPFCSPSRTALWSGVSPWKSGIYDNGLLTEQSLALQEATYLPKLFKDAGYYVAAYGKISHGWGDRGVWDDRIAHKRDPVPPNAPFISVARGEQDWGPTNLKEEEMGDTTYADAAIRQLQQEHDKPFFIACGLFHPHMPWYVPHKYFDMYPLDEVIVPKIRENNLDDIPQLGGVVTDGKRRFVDDVIEKDLLKRGVQAYLATTSYADAQIGRMLDALAVSPYRDNTLVMLMSDHGFHLGEKNHWQKGTLWEEATHCLLMVRVPGMTELKGQSQRFVSLQDVYPTLTEICRLDTPVYIDG